MTREFNKNEKEQISRIVNANFMVSLVKTLSEEMEFFRDAYGGHEKNVFKRIVKNCELLFDPKKMSDLEIKEIETISDAMIDSIYDLKKQYRSHVEKNVLEQKVK